MSAVLMEPPILISEDQNLIARLPLATACSCDEFYLMLGRRAGFFPGLVIIDGPQDVFAGAFSGMISILLTDTPLPWSICTSQGITLQANRNSLEQIVELCEFFTTRW
ncbi:MAG: hypothetical protein JST35_05395 [Armatimonadetes bacterium]|nr:hypothetical protein [Armatimonadota bacterium]